jgi:hypothetical protein
MSWDLDVVPSEHSSDPNEWLESLVGTPGDTAAARAHAAAVRVTRPELEASEPDEDGAIELGPSEESGLPLQVFSTAATRLSTSRTGMSVSAQKHWATS